MGLRLTSPRGWGMGFVSEGDPSCPSERREQGGRFLCPGEPLWVIGEVGKFLCWWPVLLGGCEVGVSLV